MTIWDWPFESASWRRPWDEVQRALRVLDNLAGERLGRAFPAVNLWSDDQKAVLTAEVPGVDREKLEVSVENDVATLRGTRERAPVGQDERLLRHERGHGDFARSIPLPFAVEAEKVEATYKDGVLRVTLPRSEAGKPRKIDVKG